MSPSHALAIADVNDLGDGTNDGVADRPIGRLQAVRPGLGRSRHTNRSDGRTATTGRRVTKRTLYPAVRYPMRQIR